MYIHDYIEMIRGNAFPAVPFETQLFYRDDLNIWYIYDGTVWVSLQAPGMIVHGNAWHIPAFAAQADLLAHIAVTATPIHGSSVAAAFDTLIHRDATGRAQIIDPAVVADIDNMGARDAAILLEALARALADFMHAAITAPPIHGSTVAANFNTLIHRDPAGRAQIVNPAVAADIDNLGARNAAITVHAALSTGVHGVGGGTVGIMNRDTVLVDADNDTKIQVEESADEDKIRFDTAGSERMIIDENGDVHICDEDIIFGTTSRGIKANTVDGSDNHSVKLSGGGAPSSSRGAVIVLGGNEEATFLGDLVLNPGNPAAAQVKIDGTIYVGAGKVGIGETSPDAPLEISAGNGVGLHIDGTANLYVDIDRSAANRRGELWFSTADSINWALGVGDSDEGPGDDSFFIGRASGIAGFKLRIAPDGSVYMPDVYNDALAGPKKDLYIQNDGQLGHAPSSKRYKKNIEPMGNLSERIYKLVPVQFQWKSDDSKDYGLIAEEVEKVMPNLVTYDEIGRPETVEYSRLIPFMLNEIINLRSRISKN